ncbi:hypothetical protein OK349_18935 [Sphingomonas sp. BT-65]|uniref:hypothetical protein n=1 Tax=Sphingomonas sp. BT-65 TaxID=2989821 RepID=UPI002235443F|nr:hypothetical protein [Sphingomonas sp. BT-65]MCW4463785.1 hypothetical protein [Sphingomonas sp. BT-65]
MRWFESSRPSQSNPSGFGSNALKTVSKTVDANGNTLARALLAGTGHDGSEALVTHAFNADSAAGSRICSMFRTSIIQN